MPQIEPGKQSLRIRKGVDFPFTFEIDIDGTVLDLTGATVLSQIRESQNRIAELITDFTVVVTSGAETGYLSDITLSLTDTQTAAIEQSEGFYDVLVIDGGGNDTYYLEGHVTFVGSTTVKP